MARNESTEVPGAIRLMIKVWGAFSALCKCNFILNNDFQDLSVLIRICHCFELLLFP